MSVRSDKEQCGEADGNRPSLHEHTHLREDTHTRSGEAGLVGVNESRGREGTAEGLGLCGQF